MNCRKARILSTQNLRQALSPEDQEALDRHLQGCNACSQERSHLKSVATDLLTARTLPFLPSDTLKSRIRLAVDANMTAAGGRNDAAARFARVTLGFAVFATLLGAFLTTARSHDDESMAQAVGNALSHVNTWHLKGWKLRNGQQIPWEAWGRQQPYLFRERVGEEVTFDNGKIRIRQFAPDLTQHRPKGICLTMASVGDIARFGGGVNYEGLSYRNMISASNWLQVQKPIKHDSAGTVFRISDQSGVMGISEEEYYTVAPQTALPVLYEHTVTQNQLEVVNEHLAAEYNIPLPGVVTMSTPPNGYPIIDVTRPDAALPTENVVSKEGLAVQVVPIGVDPQGDVLLRVRGWLGNFQLGSVNATTARLLLEVNMADSYRDEKGRPTYRDDRNQPYFYVQSAARSAPGGDFLCLLAPRRPVLTGDPLPRSITLTLGCTPAYGLTWINHSNGSEEDTRLFTEQMTMTVPLPAKATVSQASMLYPAGMRAFRFGAPLEAVIDTERTGEIWMSANEQRDPTKKHELLQETLATYKEAVQLIGPRNQEYWPDQFLLAYYCSYAGKYDEAKTVLKAIINEGHRHGNWKGDTLRAENDLKHVEEPSTW